MRIRFNKLVYIRGVTFTIKELFIHKLARLYEYGY